MRNYWNEQFIAGNKTKKPSDELPTDQEHNRSGLEIELTEHTVFS